MDTALLKQKLHDYIDTAEDKKLEAIYTILEGEIEDEPYDWRKDEEWLAELDRREKSVLDGTAKTHSLEETLDIVRQATKKPVLAK
jgi:hypothetical protein